MFCPSCGNTFDENMAFCPACGAPASQTPVSIPVNNTANVNVPPPVAPAPKKQSNTLKIVAIILAVVLLLAVAGVGIYLVIKNKEDDAKNQDEAADAVGNPFAVQMGSVAEDAEQTPVLETFSAVYNCLFNTNSFTLRADMYGDEAELKVQFGKDLASSQIYFELDDYVYISLYDGDFVYAAGREGMRLGIADIASGGEDLITATADRIIAICDEYIERYKNTEYKETAGIYEDLKAEMEELKEKDSSLKSDVLSIVSDNKLNLSAADSLISEILSFKQLADDAGQQGMVSRSLLSIFDLVNTVGSLEEALKIVADFLANGLDDVTITTEKSVSGEGDSAVTVYDIEFNAIDAEVAFIEFVYENDDYAKLFPEGFIENMREEYGELKEDYKAGYMITVNAEISENCIRKLIINDFDGNELLEIKVSDVNSTTVTSSDYDNADDAYDAADYKMAFDNADEIIEEVY